jgi:hypothetical protein
MLVNLRATQLIGAAAGRPLLISREQNQGRSGYRVARFAALLYATTPLSPADGPQFVWSSVVSRVA